MIFQSVSYVPWKMFWAPRAEDKKKLQSAYEKHLHMVYDHGQGQLRFPCLAAAGDAACEMCETHGLHQTQVPPPRGFSHISQRAQLIAVGQVNNIGRLTQKISD